MIGDRTVVARHTGASRASPAGTPGSANQHQNAGLASGLVGNPSAIEAETNIGGCRTAVSYFDVLRKREGEFRPFSFSTAFSTSSAFATRGLEHTDAGRPAACEREHLAVGLRASSTSRRRAPA